MKRLSLYFIEGLLVLLPILGTFSILAFIYTKIAGLGNAILFPLIERPLPGIDFVFVIFTVILIGVVANWWISKKVLKLLEQLIFKMPGVKNIYNTIKDTVKSLAGNEKKFDTVVLVYLSEDIARLGFLTAKDSPFKTLAGREMVGVYFPQTFQVAGDLFWVPRECMEILDMPTDQALKLIISGGVTGLNTRTAGNDSTTSGC